MAKVQSAARLIVALHIGSKYSRFAYDPEEIFLSDDWRYRGGESSKTLSAIYYEPGNAATAEVKSWGYAACTDYDRKIGLLFQRPSGMPLDNRLGTYFENFEDARDSSTSLPQGFTLSRIISDYLRLMGALIMSTLQRKYGNHVSMNDVEWCVVLAHDWGDHAMKLMRTSMERAGLVQSAISIGGSPHPLRFVCDLEAASYHCLRGSHIQVGDKLLVADLGFKSCRITAQEVHSVERSKFEVKQVAESVAVLDAPNQWNLMLTKLLKVKMLPVQNYVEFRIPAFKRFIKSLLKELSLDLCYDVDKDYPTGYMSTLSINAQNRWKQLDVQHGNPIRDSYDVIEFTMVDIQSALQACVDGIVALIAPQLLSTPDIKAILLDGVLCSNTPFISMIVKDLNSPVKVVTSVISAASKGAVAMVLDQVFPFTWNGEGKLLKYHPAASSSHGDGISGQTSSPKIYEVLLARGSTSPSFESSNALGGGEASESSLKKKPSNSRVEGVVKKYSWDQVLQMTEDLTSRELGKGGFGTVYLGKLENGKEVAVKVLNQSSQEGKLETFVNEVNLLIQVNHVNLVKLLGYCQGKRNVVIYEYVEEGSIGDHLHGDKTRLNDWKQRLSIMLQAAYGLDYLHSLCSPTIIHRDIKSENILLTKNMVAKVADFGISKFMGADDVDMKTYLNTKVIGSLWYIDPEYQETGQLRQSSDVYSFGILLLEMISGRKPFGIGAWVNKLYGNGGGGAIKAIADSNLSGNYNPKAMKVVIKLAISCIDADGTSRPMMRHVVGELQKAQLIEEAEMKSWIPFWRH